MQTPHDQFQQYKANPTANFGKIPHNVFPGCTSVRPLFYLLLNHWTKVNQIRCVSLSHEWGVQWYFFALPLGALGRSQKVKYHLISTTKSISKIFILSFLCVLTKLEIQIYQIGFSFCRLSHAPEVGFWGTGVPRFSKNSNKVMRHIKLTGMTSKTECK